MKTRNKLTPHYACRPALLILAAAVLQTTGIVHAAFHLWAVTEVYSSPDGSVQFVRLTNNSTFTTEYFMAGHQIVCTGPQGTNTFNFPANLPAVSTLNKNFVIGTSNLASVPGGLTPDYVFTNTRPFLFITPGVTNTLAIISSAEPSAVCTNLPLDGASSLLGLGTVFAAAPNRLRNFNDQTNHIVPVRFLSQQLSDTDCVMSFATATGVNGSAGPTYSVEYKTNFSDLSWSLLTTISGNGSTQTVSNSVSEAPQRFFRLTVP